MAGVVLRLIFRLTVAPKGPILTAVCESLYMLAAGCHRIVADGWLVLMSTALAVILLCQTDVQTDAPSSSPVTANVQPQSEDCVVPQGQITRPDKPIRYLA